MTSRPPSASCDRSVSGTDGAPAVTRIRSNGAPSGQPSVPSPTTIWTLSVPERAQPRGGLLGEGLVPFDRDHGPGKARQHRRLVARPGADFEDAIRILRGERGRHDGDHVGLRDGLHLADRNGPIVVRFSAPGGGHESVARDLAQHREQARVTDAAALDLLFDHGEPRAGLVHLSIMASPVTAGL